MKKKTTLITGLLLAELPEENVKSRPAFLSSLGAEKELKLFDTVSAPAKDKDKTLLRAQRTRGLSSAYQSNLFLSYHKYKTNLRSNLVVRKSTKH